MHKRIKPSPAMVVAIMALVVALGGTAVAGSHLTSAKHKHSDKKADTKLFKKLLKKAAPTLSVGHAATAGNATTANHATSADTASSAQPRAFAQINPDGTVASGKGVGNANVTHPGGANSGIYCVSGLAFAIKGAAISTQFAGTPTFAQFSVGNTASCPNGGQVRITTNGGAVADESFQIVLWG